MQNSVSKLEVRASPPRMRRASGSGCREQASFNSAQAFPCGLGQCRVCPNQIADHLPCGEVERALGCRPHRQRNRALRAETDALRRRLLAGPDPYGLREQKNCHRFLTGLKLTTTAKAIQVVQTSSPRVSAKGLFPLLSPRRWRWRKYVEGFLPATDAKILRTNSDKLNRHEPHF